MGFGNRCADETEKKAGAMGRFDAESVGRGNLSRGGNAATSLILTASLRRDDSDIHILTFLAFHWIWPSSPPFPYLYIRIQLVY